MIETLLIVASIASLLFMVYNGIFVRKQSAVRIPVRVEDDDTIRRILIRHR